MKGCSDMKDNKLQVQVKFPRILGNKYMCVPFDQYHSKEESQNPEPQSRITPTCRVIGAGQFQVEQHGALVLGG